jgi:cysteine desulfurase
VTFISVDAEGRIDAGELADAVRPETALVSVMWANNETGVLSPMVDMANALSSRRVLFHSDAVQAVGKIPVPLGGAGVHFASISAHKLHGPKGVGALFVDRHTPFRAHHIGAGQEESRRAGTENVASIIGFGKAAELALAKLDTQQTHVRALRDRFEQTLLATVPDTFVNGGGADRLPNTSSLSFGGVESEAALLLFDQQQLCCSAGSACRSGAVHGSQVLRAMGLSDERIRGSIRFSFGRFNTEADVDRALDIIPRAINKLRALATPKQSAAAVR